MTSVSDIIHKDDDDHLIRAIVARLQQLEGIVAQVTQPGMLVQLPGDLRGNAWSSNRSDSVGSNWSRWYQLNDVNETSTFEEKGGSPSNRLTVVGSPAPVQGQPGALRSDGSYSVRFDTSSYLSFPYVALGTRSWTIEAIFMIDSTELFDQEIARAGTTNGPGVTVRGSGGSNKISAYLRGPNVYLDTTVTAVGKNWYHVIFVGEAATNMSWYVGRFDPSTRAFSFSSGSVAMPSPPTAVSSNGRIGEFSGFVDDVLVYNGVLTSNQAENRIRAALQVGAPSGWLVADGTAVSRNKYPALFSRIGTFNGAGNGSSTFNLPNYPGGIVKT